jgi:nicotinamide-nucleotide amidase
MNAHIITIGDEILIGQTLNTNAAFIGSQLTAIQVNVVKTSVVGDNEKDIIEEFRATFENNDILIVTGGLGPTHDDLTRDCVVKYFDTALVKNEEVLADINALFKKRGRIVTPLNEDQANVPANCEIIRNTNGTAPGYWIENGNKFFIVMPGVPYEMKNMMERIVIPRLKEIIGTPSVYQKRLILQTTGIPESSLFERLGNIEELLSGAKMAFLPSQFGVKLRITAEAKDEDEAANHLLEIEQKIRSKAGRFIYTKGEESLEEVVGRILKERTQTIAVAESCTGGYISNLLTNVPGSSAYLERGIISYSNAAKVELLRVNEDTITQYGAVSQEVALQMAEGVKSISGTDIGLAVTGIMGPTGAVTGKPVGLVFIGICNENLSTVKKYIFGEDRLLNKQRTAQAALELIRRMLLGIPLDD